MKVETTLFLIAANQIKQSYQVICVIIHRKIGKILLRRDSASHTARNNRVKILKKSNNQQSPKTVCATLIGQNIQANNSSTACSNTCSNNNLSSSTNPHNAVHNVSYLSRVRVIKKNLVYVIGIAPQLANEQTLSSYQYFGQYGEIQKLVVNKNNIYNPKGPNGPSFSAYITFAEERDASLAVLGTENFKIYDRIIRASYGTTKYCSYFLKNQDCPNIPDCLYLHSYGKDDDYFSKDEMVSNKNIFIDQQKIAIKNIKKYIPQILIEYQQKRYFYETQLHFFALPNLSKVLEKLRDYGAISVEQFITCKESNQYIPINPPVHGLYSYSPKCLNSYNHNGQVVSPVQALPNLSIIQNEYENCQNNLYNQYYLVQENRFAQDITQVEVQHNEQHANHHLRIPGYQSVSPSQPIERACFLINSSSQGSPSQVSMNNIQNPYYCQQNQNNQSMSISPCNSTKQKLIHKQSCEYVTPYGNIQSLQNQIPHISQFDIVDQHKKQQENVQAFPVGLNQFNNLQYKEFKLPEVNNNQQLPQQNLKYNFSFPEIIEIPSDIKLQKNKSVIENRCIRKTNQQFVEKQPEEEGVNQNNEKEQDNKQIQNLHEEKQQKTQLEEKSDFNQKQDKCEKDFKNEKYEQNQKDQQCDLEKKTEINNNEYVNVLHHTIQDKPNPIQIIKTNDNNNCEMKKDMIPDFFTNSSKDFSENKSTVSQQSEGQEEQIYQPLHFQQKQSKIIENIMTELSSKSCLSLQSCESLGNIEENSKCQFDNTPTRNKQLMLSAPGFSLPKEQNFVQNKFDSSSKISNPNYEVIANVWEEQNVNQSNTFNTKTPKSACITKAQDSFKISQTQQQSFQEKDNENKLFYTYESNQNSFQELCSGFNSLLLTKFN